MADNSNRLTRAEGTFSNCGPGVNTYELRYSCKGPACSTINEFQNIKCSNDGGSMICSNDVKCPPGISSFQSNFTFQQNEGDPWKPQMQNEPDSRVQQQQRIALPNCEKFTLVSDGTKEGTKINDGGAMEESTCPKVKETPTPTAGAGLAKKTSSTSRPTSSATSRPQQQSKNAGLRRGGSKNILCVTFLLGLILLLPSASASTVDRRRDEVRRRAELRVRDVSDKVKNFAKDFSSDLAVRANAAGQNGDVFAHNLVADVVSSVCDEYFSGQLPGSFAPVVVQNCMKSIYGGERLPQAAGQFFAVFGASLLCDYVVSEAYPVAREFFPDGCEGLQDLAKKIAPTGTVQASNAATPAASQVSNVVASNSPVSVPRVSDQLSAASNVLPSNSMAQVSNVNTAVSNAVTPVSNAMTPASNAVTPVSNMATFPTVNPSNGMTRQIPTGSPVTVPQVSRLLNSDSPVSDPVLSVPTNIVTFNSQASIVQASNSLVSIQSDQLVSPNRNSAGQSVLSLESPRATPSAPSIILTPSASAAVSNSQVPQSPGISITPPASQPQSSLPVTPDSATVGRSVTPLRPVPEPSVSRNEQPSSPVSLRTPAGASSPLISPPVSFSRSVENTPSVSVPAQDTPSETPNVRSTPSVIPPSQSASSNRIETGTSTPNTPRTTPSVSSPLLSINTPTPILSSPTSRSITPSPMTTPSTPSPPTRSSTPSPIITPPTSNSTTPIATPTPSLCVPGSSRSHFCTGFGCVDLMTNNTHCGNCEAPCKHECYKGQCLCPGTHAQPNKNGTCTTQCPDGQYLDEKYQQCCPNGTQWNPTSKNCTNTGTQCPTGYSFFQPYEACCPPQSLPSRLFRRQMVGCVCPGTNQPLRAATCKDQQPCPQGQTRDETYQKCCPTGTNWSPQQNNCTTTATPKTCPNTHILYEDLGYCCEKANKRATSSKLDYYLNYCTCLDGRKIDPETGCDGTKPGTCPAGQHMDKTYLRCCKDGFTFSWPLQSCVEGSGPCPPGSSWNTTVLDCVCADGKLLNSDKMCGSTVSISRSTSTPILPRTSSTPPPGTPVSSRPSSTPVAPSSTTPVSPPPQLQTSTPSIPSPSSNPNSRASTPTSHTPSLPNSPTPLATPCPSTAPTLCSARCVNLQTDLSNCGNCGIACAGTCGNGICTVVSVWAPLAQHPSSTARAANWQLQSGAVMPLITHGLSSAVATPTSTPRGTGAGAGGFIMKGLDGAW